MHWIYQYGLTHSCENQKNTPLAWADTAGDMLEARSLNELPEFYPPIVGTEMQFTDGRFRFPALWRGGATAWSR